MRSTILTLVISLGLPALGAEPTAPPAEPLKLRPKAALAASNPGHTAAPFVLPLAPEPELLPRHDLREEKVRSSCSGSTSLCYDPNARQVVYKPARAFMPTIPGLQPENISVRRDRITLRYSF
jgi:hypothetical protein